MDFSLKSLADAFKSTNLKDVNFKGYAFILTTSSDNKFDELFAAFSDIHEVSKGQLLIFAPNPMMNVAQGIPMDTEQILEVLNEGEFTNHYNGEKVDVSQTIKSFKQKVTKESYAFAKIIELDTTKFPCIVFFNDLVTPEKYAYLPINSLSTQDIVKIFRNLDKDIPINGETDVVNLIARYNIQNFAGNAVRVFIKHLPTIIKLSALLSA